MTMAFAFDTLGYAQRLRSAGIPQDQAEAHAEAAREFIMAELVTKTDLAATRSQLEQTMGHLEQTIATTRTQLEQGIAMQTLQLTVRMGVLIAAGIALLGAILCGALLAWPRRESA